MSRSTPCWRLVHGEEMGELLGAAEFMQGLWEMDIYPNLEIFAPETVQSLEGLADGANHSTGRPIQ